jgi:hypothetical protein
MSQYQVVTEYEGHPVYGEWTSTTGRPFESHDEAVAYADRKREHFAVRGNELRDGRIKSIRVEEIGALKGLNFNDNEFTVDYWAGDKLNAPVVEFRMYGDEFDLNMEQARELAQFLVEALKLGKGWTRGG